ncbi:UNVERIFIED_CONTAM: Protein SENSITIVE TO PROTON RHIZOTOXICITY 1 [Sesamum indicum]
MDPEERLCADTWTKSSSGCESLNTPPNIRIFTDFNSQQQKWANSSFLVQQHFPDFNQPFGAQNTLSCNVNTQKQMSDPQDKPTCDAHESSNTQDWDPRAMLNNLSFLETKIHQLQDLVHLIVERRGQVTGRADQVLVQQQQLITADLTSIIVQLISTAGSLLPSVTQTLCSGSSISQLGQFAGVTNQSAGVLDNVPPHNNNVNKVEDNSDLTGYFGAEQNCPIEDHEMKSDDDADEGENLPPGSYEILQLEKEEILAPHTHFCTICGKGFKRDANLRMHMRGHGDEYKTPAALAKPNKESSSELILIKRYSCPYVGCKRNKDHKKFQPLKTILCVKNHYKRTHCDKTYTCSRCNTKKFSVIADLKTHEKHCGRDKWLCSCGTTFSRKDKLFGHIALFQGHTPAIPIEESKGSAGPSDRGQCSEATNKVEQLEFNYKLDAPSRSACQNVMDVEGAGEDPTSYFSPLGFDTSSMSGFHEFPRPPFEDSENSFSFLLSGACYPPKNGRYTGSNDLE